MEMEASPTWCINLLVLLGAGPRSFKFLFNYFFLPLSIRRGSLSKGQELLRKLRALALFVLCPGSVMNGLHFCSWVPVLLGLVTSPDKEGFWKCNGKPNSSYASCVQQSKNDSNQQQLLRKCWQTGHLWAAQGKTEKPDKNHVSWFHQSKDRAWQNHKISWDWRDPRGSSSPTGWSWSRHFLLWEIPDFRTTFQRREKKKALVHSHLNPKNVAIVLQRKCPQPGERN